RLRRRRPVLSEGVARLRRRRRGHALPGSARVQRSLDDAEGARGEHRRLLLLPQPLRVRLSMKTAMKTFLASALAVFLLPATALASKADAFENKIQPVSGHLFLKDKRF